MNKRVLITGGGGLVGRHLCDELVRRGYVIHILTRSKGTSDTKQVRHFIWDVARRQLDAACLESVGSIVHLAGENIGALPWSKQRKRAIADSRIDSISLLYRHMETTPHGVKVVVSASATGYYGNRGDELLTEDQPPQEGFLGETCVDWENAVCNGKQQGVRVVSLRSGIVLASDGGIYKKIRNPTRVGFGVIFGSGRQYLPWIQIDDAVRAYIHAIENPDVSGAYNMVAPEQVTNAGFTKQIASFHDKPVCIPPIPAIALKVVLGQMSELLLDSTRVSSEKLVQSGFEFHYPTLQAAITQCEQYLKRNLG